MKKQLTKFLGGNRMGLFILFIAIIVIALITLIGGIIMNIIIAIDEKRINDDLVSKKKP